MKKVRGESFVGAGEMECLSLNLAAQDAGDMALELSRGDRVGSRGVEEVWELTEEHIHLSKMSSGCRQ